MNYPDNLNTARFDATIGSRETVAEQEFDIVSVKVQEAVTAAFAQFPDGGMGRWMQMCLVLCEAEARLEPYVSLSVSDQDTIDSEIEFAIDANDDDDREAVAQNLRSVMSVYRGAIDRRGA